MTDRYVEEAKQNMNFLERLLKGLPGISGYVDRSCAAMPTNGCAT